MPPRERKKIVFSPTWEGIAVGDLTYKDFALSYIKKQKWRCDRMFEHTDLVQECWIIFNRCVTRYPRVVDPPHFLALFKTALRNYFHDHARYTRKHLDEVPCDVSTSCAHHIGELGNEGYLRVLLKKAPEEVIYAFKVLTTNEGNTWQRKVRHRENLNMELRRLTGFDRMRLDHHRKYNFREALDVLFE